MMEMAWKKTATANCLLGTSLPREITCQIAAAEAGAGWSRPQGARSQDKREVANLQLTL